MTVCDRCQDAEVFHGSPCVCQGPLMELAYLAAEWTACDGIARCANEVWDKKRWLCGDCASLLPEE